MDASCYEGIRTHNETRVFGPPGTGKTTYLSRQIEAAASKHYPEDIIVASYTKTAAAELNSRNLPIPKENIGTLHALCYRALGSPEIAEVHADEFSEENSKFKVTKLNGSHLDEGMADVKYDTDGDALLAEYNLLRVGQIPTERWPPRIMSFIHAWEAWKGKNHYVDFTDMITITLKRELHLPGAPKIGIYDEVQDFSRAQLELIRMWAKDQEYVILAGDDDQAIFGWCGASGEAFLNPPVPDSQKRILQQSWRLPRQVQQFSSDWIRKVKNREPKEYKPRDEEGEVLRSAARIDLPHRAIELAMEYVEAGKTVMFLTSCGYMLNPIKDELRKYGIPFHNPFRKTRKDWNPLGDFSPGHRGAHSTRERIVSFISNTPDTDFWDFESLTAWTDIVRTKGIFKKSGKERIGELKSDAGCANKINDYEWYESIFEADALEHAFARNLGWFVESLLGAKRKPAEFPMQIYHRRGRVALSEPPKIIISTIHGVKGGEASVVFLFPDISLSAYQGYKQNPDLYDATIRTFYVGMTRAKESLILCAPSNNLHVKI